VVCRDLGVGDDDQYEACVANADSRNSDAQKLSLTANTVYHIIPANCAIEWRDDASGVYPAFSVAQLDAGPVCEPFPCCTKGGNPCPAQNPLDD
jgi:hypothetical protein